MELGLGHRVEPIYSYLIPDFYIWGTDNSVMSTANGTQWESAFSFDAREITAAYIEDFGLVAADEALFFSSDLKTWGKLYTFQEPVFQLADSYGAFWAGMMNDDDEELNDFLLVFFFLTKITWAELR